MDVSIVLPVFNVAGHLLTELGRIRAAIDASPYTYGVLMVEDGSTDGGVEELPDLNSGFRAFRKVVAGQTSTSSPPASAARPRSR